MQSFNLAKHTLPSALKWMREGGVLVPAAQANRKGSGCFKFSAGERTRMAAAGRAAAKKLKV